MNATILAITSSDERLWQAVESGDTAAFESVVQRYQGAVAGVAFNLVGDFAASQDIAQETFWTAWKSKSQLREPARLGGWLCGIARNLSSEWLRKQKSTKSLESSAFIGSASREPDPAEQSISNEEQELVWHSLEELPPNYREVLVLFYRHGRSIAEVAVSLDISEDAAKQRLSRGREMLREQLVAVVEDVLLRSRPGRGFTNKVMAGLVGLGAAIGAGGSASAATVSGKIAGGALSGAAATVTKSVLATGAGAGVAGGLVGAAGGLGGAWLGTWLPAQLAPTMTERRLLESNGKRLMRVSLGYMLLILVCTPLLFFGMQLTYFLAIGAATVAFVIVTIVNAVGIQKKISKIRNSIRPEEDPNPSAVKSQLQGWQITAESGWQGRQFTSTWQLLGLPLLDIQFRDPGWPNPSQGNPCKVARGWIALGDRAQGVLLGVGGIARGLIAVGGVAYGVVAIGGVALGLISLGGLAIGLLACGGGALGHTALGGGAVGWNAAGGMALGWNSAVGGMAVARHVSFGGLSIASDFATGGQAYADQINTPLAHEAVSQESLKWTLDWYLENQALALAIILVGSILPVLLIPLIYRRQKR